MSNLDSRQRKIASDFCTRLEASTRIRAALRRATELDDLIGIREVDRFVHEIGGAPFLSEDSRLGMATLLAHPKVDRRGPWEIPGSASLAKRFGQKAGDRPVLSELRFARLIHAPDVPARLRLLRRALGVLGQEISPGAVSEGWLQLDSPAGRRRFARAYFTADDEHASAQISPVPAET